MKKLLFGLLGLIIALPGWATCYNYTSATGTVTQTGTPSPTNPIEPVFYKQGNMMLRKINDTYADSYDATTGKITRRVGVKVLDGTENWIVQNGTYPYFRWNTDSISCADQASTISLSSHFLEKGISINNTEQGFSVWHWTQNNVGVVSIRMDDTYVASAGTLDNFKQWLAAQYAAGTPVTVYYPLEEPVEETIGTQWCEYIKIATTAYNTAQFNPVVTDLNTTIATIRSVVTNTINQTKAIADLQAKKQTRPDEQCPAGKKCLLVEDNDGVPHWYEIIENVYGLPAGYTPLEYIQSDGNSYINTGITSTSTTNIEFIAKTTNTGTQYIGGCYGESETNIIEIAQARATGTLIADIGNYSGNRISSNVSAQTEFRTMLIQGNSFYINNTLIGTITNGYRPNGGNCFIAHSTFGTQGGEVQYKEAKIWNDSRLVFDGVPAKRNSDGVIGMYDLADTNPATAFHTNAGTGTFTAGPEI